MIVDLVKDFLDNEGYRPKFDSDGDLTFRAEGLHFLYYANNDDQGYFQLVLPGIYDVTDENREQVLQACNHVCLDLKVVKAIIIRDSVWLNVEMLLDKNPKVEDLIPRCINMLIGARHSFYEKVD